MIEILVEELSREDVIRGLARIKEQEELQKVSTNLNNLKIGDKVLVECYSGLGTGGVASVSGFTVKYDRNSGEPYPIVILEDGHQFDMTTGNAVTPPTAYYISGKVE